MIIQIIQVSEIFFHLPRYIYHKPNVSSDMSIAPAQPRNRARYVWISVPLQGVGPKWHRGICRPEGQRQGGGVSEMKRIYFLSSESLWIQTLSEKVLNPPNYSKLYPKHFLRRYLDP